MPTYPYDPSGTEPTNLIENESRYIQPPGDLSDASFVILQGAPFFKDSLEVWTGPNRTGMRLQEGEHFNLCFEAPGLELAIGKILYGGFYLLNRNYTGTLYMHYQALGGNHTVNSVSALEILHRKLHEIIYITWDMIAGVPETVPPAFHLHTSDQDTMQQVIGGLTAIRDALPLYFNP